MFDVTVSNQSLDEVESDLLVVPCEPDHASSALNALNEATDLDILALAAEEKFASKPGQTFVVRGLRGLATHRVLLVGLGAPEDRDPATLLDAGRSVARLAQKMHTSRIATTAPPHPEDTLRLVEGIILGAYRFDRYVSQSDDDFDGIEELTVLSLLESLDHEVSLARKIATGVNLARDLVNESPNELTPDALATRARNVASTHKFECTIFDEDELVSRGFNLIMAVGKGSTNGPRFVHMVYKPEGDVTHRVAFLGKGITFDTGGYNLKTGGSMLAMHSDMAGAAAVIGAAQAIGEIRPPNVEIHFMTPIAENLISGTAMKPNDIFRGYGNKTVEIHNTDAEGRLVLADALSYAQDFEFDTIVDLATLTGACVVALGETTAGLFSDDDDLAEALLSSAKNTGESVWRMPLDAKLDSQLDTPHADMRNIGERWGGAITAALFLKRWIRDDFEGAWAHMDIAGPAFASKDSETIAAGGTGFAVATLVEYARNLGLTETSS